MFFVCSCFFKRREEKHHHPNGGGEEAAPPKRREGDNDGKKWHHPKGKREESTTSQEEEGETCTTPKEAGKQHRPQGGRGNGESNISPQEEGRSSLWVVLPSPPSLFSRQGKAKQGVVGRDSSSSALSPLWRCCFPILPLLRGAAFSPPDLKMLCFLDNFLFDFLETAKKTQAWSVGQIREASTSFSKEVPFLSPLCSLTVLLSRFNPSCGWWCCLSSPFKIMTLRKMITIIKITTKRNMLTIQKSNYCDDLIKSSLFFVLVCAPKDVFQIIIFFSLCFLLLLLSFVSLSCSSYKK